MTWRDCSENWWSAGNRIAGGETETHDMGANGMIDSDSIVRMTTDSDRWIPFEDDSGTIAPTPRRALIVALTKTVNDATVVGDRALARFAAELLSACSVWRLVRRKARRDV